MECKHKRWINLFPPKGSCFIHHESNAEDEALENNTIAIKICVDCGKILSVVDYGE